MMDNLKIAQLVLGPVQTNCCLVLNTQTGQILVIDPADRPDVICAAAKEMGGKICAILLTHGHYDHIGAVPVLQSEDGIPVMALGKEAPLLADPLLNLSGMHGEGISVRPDRLLEDKEVLNVGGFEFKVIALPGHTAGGAGYYLEKVGILFAGDTLFYHSVGRSDLPTGDAGTLLNSIRTRLLVLPDETIVLPGHDVRTSIGEERQFNPFLRDGGWDMF